MCKPLDIDTYGQIVHSRLNHVQTLATTMYALPIAVAAALLHIEPSPSDPGQPLTIAVGAWFALLLGSYFVIYQVEASLLAVDVLVLLEPQSKDSSEKRYFSHILNRRLQFRIGHTLPTWAFIASPFFFAGLKLWSWGYAYGFAVAGILATVGIWLWLGWGVHKQPSDTSAPSSPTGFITAAGTSGTSPPSDASNTLERP